MILVDDDTSDDASKRREVDDSEEWIRVQSMVIRLSDKATLLNDELKDQLKWKFHFLFYYLNVLI